LNAPFHYTYLHENNKADSNFEEHKLSTKHSEENNQYTHLREKENAYHDDNKITTHENYPSENKHPSNTH